MLTTFFFNSQKSYGSHKNRSYKGSHKCSIDSLNGEEKKDASKEDLDDGKLTYKREIRK